MGEIKQGDIVFHKATNQRGVVTSTWVGKEYRDTPPRPMAAVDFGIGQTVNLPVTSVSLVVTPDVLARLATLESRVVELEKGMLVV